MKSPLRYQATDADCGKTSLVNALMYLFDREEIPPQAIDFITRVTGDCNLGINDYYRGTSANALSYVGVWCNDYLVHAGMPVRCKALRDDEVSFSPDSPLVLGLHSGAVAVCGCLVGVDHYVLITGYEEGQVRMFDPYYESYPPEHYTLTPTGVMWVDDQPFSHNRLVDAVVLDNPNAPSYSLYAKSGRDALLIWRTSDEPFSWHA
ncbi:MAG: hypothetical protein IKG22_06390 [Atopobiaceae bacterium]|nr:hypothetical protein [Atopobiaceae bacterium]